MHSPSSNLYSPSIPRYLWSSDSKCCPLETVLRVLGSRITNLNLSISILLSPHWTPSLNPPFGHLPQCFSYMTWCPMWFDNPRVNSLRAFSSVARSLQVHIIVISLAYNKYGTFQICSHPPYTDELLGPCFLFHWVLLFFQMNTFQHVFIQNKRQAKLNGM